MKVLFLTGKLQEYRIPILEEIVAKSNIELTVAHSDKAIIPHNSKITEVILLEKKIWKFTKHHNDFLSFCDQFDVVVAMFYIQKISFMQLLFRRKRNYKLIYWGIGVKTSHNHKFGDPSITNKIRYLIAKKADAMIFYSDFAKDIYINKGIDSGKIFVMQNTVVVENKIQEPLERSTILFVGALFKRKKINELLEGYLAAYHRVEVMPKLHIIGNGEEYQRIELWVINNSMTDQIILHGAIYDEAILESFFKKALATISPGQAGLSVLKSMGYGTPFITTEDAITGGERLNIIHKENGILYNNDYPLEDVLVDIALNKDYYVKLGKKALKHYLTKTTPAIMAHGFVSAVKYVTKNSK